MDTNKHKYILGALAGMILFGGGFLLRGFFSKSAENEHTMEATSQAKEEIFTCSMHPQIKLPKAGKCPICFMDLIPLETGDDEAGSERELIVSENAAQLMDIETTPVERRDVNHALRLTGKVDYDETRVTSITAWVDGRIEKLFVDYTGATVNQGDPLVELYSPALLTAQKELQQAVRTAEKLQASQSTTLRDTAAKTVDAVREKLRLWGLTPEQISEMETQTSERITIYAPASGIVVHKNAQEGMYVKTGAKIYTLADLSNVWINLNAYESDLSQLSIENDVTFTAEAWPGETFSGTVEFIDPILSGPTRTITVRASAPNPNDQLKPGLFVRAEVLNRIDAPLVIPASAPLITGQRALAYVALPDRDKPTFEGREIVLGARAGDVYIVQSGLKEGERVVTRGAFKIDAELQLQAQPNMMSHAPTMQQANESHPQTVCPIMGGAINKDVFIDYNGQRIYFCCAGCESSFMEDPEGHLEKMRDAGVEPEMIHEH